MKIGDDWKIEGDRWGWTVTEYRTVQHKEGHPDGPTGRKGWESYYPRLEQACGHVVQRCAAKCGGSGPEEVIAAIDAATRLICDAVEKAGIPNPYRAPAKEAA